MGGRVQSVARCAGIVDEQRLGETLQPAVAIRERLAGRVVWNINSTAAGRW
jgi:hypothetical protein